MICQSLYNIQYPPYKEGAVYICIVCMYGKGRVLHQSLEGEEGAAPVQVLEIMLRSLAARPNIHTI